MLLLGASAVVGVLAAACSSVAPRATPVPGTQATPVLQVVATIGILADLAGNVGGDAVRVRALVPPGADLHAFRLTPDDSIAISKAKLIISNGGGLDDWLGSSLGASVAGDTVHVVTSEGLGLDVLSAEAEGDPHFWQNPLFAVRYVERIRDGMVLADPDRAALYRQNADAYILELRGLDAEIAERLAEVPRERRRLITFHGAFGHFGDRYGWSLTSLVPQGAGEVTPKALVKVLEAIRDRGVPAVFAEPQFSEDVLRQAAGDAGVSVGTIYSDALSEDVSTYMEMMRFNAGSLVEGLR